MAGARVVLVTGVSHTLARRFARLLAAEPDVARVVGVDAVPPRGDLGAVDFVRADIRNPVISKVIAGRQVDTVVHLGVQSDSVPAGGRASAKEHNVIGTMQLLAACQQASGVERLVVRSAAAVYGSSSRDPAMFVEDMGAQRPPRHGFAKDVGEVEDYVRGFARRRPDVAVTLLRPEHLLGAPATSPLTQYLRLPVVPTPLGFDARLQVLHPTDLLAALRHAALAGVPGTFNVAGEGVVMLSQALRRLRRRSVPVPVATLDRVGTALRHLGLPGPPRDLADYLTFGRAVDTTRMRSVLGFEPQHTTASALADLARVVLPEPAPRPRSAAPTLASGGGHA